MAQRKGDWAKVDMREGAKNTSMCGRPLPLPRLPQQKRVMSIQWSHSLQELRHHIITLRWMWFQFTTGGEFLLRNVTRKPSTEHCVTSAISRCLLSWSSLLHQYLYSERKCANQLAQCRFPGLALSNAKIQIHFSNKIYGSSFVKQHSKTVMVWN